MTDARRSDQIRSGDTRRAVGAGIAFVIVAMTYGVSRLGEWQHWWASLGAVVIGALLADAFADIQRFIATPGLAPLPILVALAAVAGCVPETDQLPLVAIVPVGLVVLELLTSRQMPLAWYAVAAGAVGWGGLFGATGRASALAGALFAWWAPLLLSALVRTRVVSSRRDAIVVLVVGGIASLVMARTGGISTSVPVIVASAAGCAAVSAAAAFAIVRAGRAS